MLMKIGSLSISIDKNIECNSYFNLYFIMKYYKYILFLKIKYIDKNKIKSTMKLM